MHISYGSGFTANVPVTVTGVDPGPYFVAYGPAHLNTTAPLSTVTVFGVVGWTVQPIEINVFNTGTQTETFPLPTVSGPHASEFSFAYTEGTNCVLSPGTSCSFNLTYIPATNEAFTAVATIAEDTNTVQQTFTINASASLIPVSVSSSQLNFGSVVAGTTSTPQSITATTVTNNPVRTTVSGPFQIIQGASCPSTPCQISVAFAPAANATAGPVTGSIEVVDSGANNGVGINLSGTVVVPTTVSLSSTSLSFAQRQVNSISIPQTITLTNTGSVTLTTPGVTLVGADPSDYLLTNNCSSAVAAGHSCTINISFSPTAPGTRNATLQITSNSTTSPDTVSLTGTGTTPP